MMSKYIDFLLHIIFPNTCMFCRKPIEYNKILCQKCEADIPFTSDDVCLICQKSECICENYFSYIIAPFFYGMGSDNAIRDLKFNGNRLNARKLSLFMSEYMNKNSENVDIIIPVPLYYKDYYKRGYNQSELLAKHISKRLNVKMSNKILLKTKKTKKQHDLNMQERQINLNNAFIVENKELIRDKVILLVDDVFTTGATMNCCSQVLINSGAKKVIGLVAAKTINKIKTL